MIVELSELVKTKKTALRSALSGSWNHPHRLYSISATGTHTQIRDTRPVRTAFLTAQIRTDEIEGDLIPVITRNFVDKVPYYGGSPAPSQARGEFAMMHDVQTPWRANCMFGLDHASIKIGTTTIEPFTRFSTSDPWTAGTPFSFDLNGNMVASITGGGEPPSYGRGADIEASKCYVTINISALGLNETIRRFPWVDPWASETQIFTDFLDNWITTGGTGYSGSTSLEVIFTS